MPLVLRAPSPFDPARKLALYRCPACGTLHYPEVDTPSYETAWGGPEASSAPEVQRGPMKFYVEQGAGPDVIVAPLFRVDPAGVRTYVEVGCGFGFSLDFASRVFGWTARGYDPSDIASAGRELLGVDIRSTLLDRDTAAQDPLADLLLASEVIEHVPEPDGFLADISAALAPDGLLVVATPDGERVAADLSHGVLLPILTPGFHLVLFSAEGLRRTLLRAGFPHVEVCREGNSIRGYASRGPLRLQPDRGVDRDLYRAYLLERWLGLPPDAFLAHGYAGRLFKELVNKGLYDAATAVFSSQKSSLERVYGVDLSRPHEVAVEAADDFEAFAARTPMGLPGLAYRRGLIALNRGEAPEVTGAWFDLAVRSGTALRRALNRFGADDGETEEAIELAQVHAVLALAQQAPDQAVDEAEALLAPARLAPQHREMLAGGLLLRLVNNDALDPAKRLRPLVQPLLLAARAAAAVTVAEGRYALGLLSQADGDAASAEEHQRVAAALARQAGDGALAWRAEAAIARALCLGGEAEAAAALTETALLPALAGGGPVPVEEAGRTVGDLLLRLVGQGAPAPAQRVEEAAGPRLLQLTAAGLFALGILALNHRNDPLRAATLFDAAAGVAEEDGTRWRARANGLLASVVAGDAAAAQRRLAEIDHAREGKEIPVVDADSLVRELRARLAVPTEGAAS